MYNFKKDIEQSLKKKAFKLVDNKKNSLTEAGIVKSKDLVKVFKDRKEWGDMADKVSLTRDGNLQVVETFFFGEDNALSQLVHTWTDLMGTMAAFARKAYGVKFKLVDSFSQTQAQGKFKKLTKDGGVVGIILKVS